MTPRRTVRWLSRTTSSSFSPMGLCRGSFNTGTAQQHPRLTCCPAGWHAGMSRNRALWPTDARQRTLWSVPARYPTKNQGHGRWDRLPHSFTRAWSAQHRAGSPGVEWGLLPGGGTGRGMCKPPSFPPHLHLPSCPGSCHTAS